MESGRTTDGDCADGLSTGNLVAEAGTAIQVNPNE